MRQVVNNEKSIHYLQDNKKKTKIGCNISFNDIRGFAYSPIIINMHKLCDCCIRIKFNIAQETLHAFSHCHLLYLDIG
jgi:hypothetical protein